MIKEMNGDLIKLAKDGFFDVIGHGCNAFVTMGAGIAAQIRKEFPQAYVADSQTKRGDKSKLGTCSFTYEPYPIIANMYIQYHWSMIAPNGKLEPAPQGTVLVDYDAVRSCCRQLKEFFGDKRIIGGWNFSNKTYMLKRSS
jgi:O-acetyl-ADP-ribose deacetylase (regulator of RNase III)